jgi:hypothetical protein
VTFYELIKKAENVSVRIPKCYGSRDFGPHGSSGFLMFEDLSQIGAIKSVFESLSIDALQQVGRLFKFPFCTEIKFGKGQCSVVNTVVPINV